ncbi:MAG: HNH endonuclease [Acidimicrobiales bacterium]
MTQALVLNATYEPLCVVSSRRALMLTLEHKAEMLHPSERVLRSEKLCFEEPSVVRMRYYVRVPYHARAALNRRAVFARDGHKCQYCGAEAESIDHVVPKSRGGGHSWDNVVAACRACNFHKKDRLLEEIGMRLRHPPAPPRQRTFLLLASARMRSEWSAYLGSGSEGVLSA